MYKVVVYKLRNGIISTRCIGTYPDADAADRRAAKYNEKRLVIEHIPNGARVSNHAVVEKADI